MHHTAELVTILSPGICEQKNVSAQEAKVRPELEPEASNQSVSQLKVKISKRTLRSRGSLHNARRSIHLMMLCRKPKG